MIDKAPDAYRTISEVGDDLDLPQHVLRFWETRFSQIRPLKRGGGRRYYRPDDVELLKGIRHLLYSEGYTIKGVQRILKEQGPKAVQAFAAQLEQGGAEASAPQPPQVVPAPIPVAPIPVAPMPVAPMPVAPMPVAPSYIDTPAEEWATAPVAAPDYHPPAPEWPPLPEAVPLTPPPSAAAVPPPAPARAVVPPTVSYMRGGLLKPSVAPQAETMDSSPSGISLRRPRLPLPVEEPVPTRFAPLPEESEAEEIVASAYHEPVTTGLSDEGRRALQSALFELSECRRNIERVMASREH